jgi:hypothetical protein
LTGHSSSRGHLSKLLSQNKKNSKVSRREKNKLSVLLFNFLIIYLTFKQKLMFFLKVLNLEFYTEDQIGKATGLLALPELLSGV